MRKIITANIFNGPSDGIIQYINGHPNIKSRISINYSNFFSENINIESFFNWGMRIQIYDRYNYVFLSYTFNSFPIALTHYTMMGYEGACYAKSWELYGINKDTAIPIHYGDSSEICDLNNRTCNSSNTTTFTIDSNYATVPFSSFLFISNNGSCRENHIAMRGLEFFGTLYSEFQKYVTISMKPKITVSNFILIFIQNV